MSHTIHTFTSDDPDLDPRERAVAQIRMPMVGRGGKVSMQWNPVIFRGATAEDARSQAARWWEAEVAEWRALKDKGRQRRTAEAEAGERHLPAAFLGEPAAPSFVDDEEAV